MAHVLGEAVERSLLTRRDPKAILFPDSGSWLLGYSPIYRRTMRFFTACCIPFLLLGFAGFKNDLPKLAFSEAIFGFITIGMLMNLIDAFWTRLTVSDTGVYFKYPGRAPVTIGWEQIQRVTYSNLWKRFEIRGETRRTIRIGLNRNGLGTLRAYLENYVSFSNWASAAHVLPTLQMSDKPQYSQVVRIAGWEQDFQRHSG